MTVTSNSSISAQLAVLPSLPMPELWVLWDQHFPRRPSHRNRHYVESRLAYRIQEKAYGALTTNIRKMLVEAGAKHSKIKSASGRSAQTLLMPGTTLIREWDERQHRVTVTRCWRSSHSRISVVPGISRVCALRPVADLILECLAPASTSILRMLVGSAP